MWKSSLTTDEAAAVDALVDRAAGVDGTSALNEDAHLARNTGSYRHLLHHEDGELAGYLAYSADHGTAQLVVDPAQRRRGIGRRLVDQLAELAAPRLWAFGDAPAARGLAHHFGLVEGRALLVMEKVFEHKPGDFGDSRGLSTPTTSTARFVRAATGIELRGYLPGDAKALLAVNAAAFAHHPEQGGLDAAGLASRMAEDWFDPEGLIVAVEDGRLLGFHWTKRVGDVGEVYVLGVDPSAQGRGLGRRLLAAGLDHLASAGCRSVILYVDKADTVAVGLYESAGFAVIHRDVLYVPQGEQEGV